MTTTVQKQPTCPECGSPRVWKDGLRSTCLGPIQRWVCRECSYRSSHSEGSQLRKKLQRLQRKPIDPFCSDCSGRSDGVRRIHTLNINTDMEKNLLCRVGAAQTTGAKNLVEVETRTQEKAAGATPTPNYDPETIKGKIVEYSFWLLKQGYAKSTIEGRTKIMRRLVKLGANLYNADSVKEVIAKQEWSTGRKENAVEAYTIFLHIHDLRWEPPIYQRERKLPFIPTENEIDQLIAGCNKRAATFLQLLKETGMRCGEASKLKWTDIDLENASVRITPEKGSNPRNLRISNKLINMLNGLPKPSQMVFATADVMRKTFQRQRRMIAAKLQNPRIQQISFHTFRHWKATMEYYKTRDIFHVMHVLGHRNIKNTLLYTQLIAFKDDDYTAKVAHTEQEVCELIESGFEFVCDYNGNKIFRKRR